MKKIAIANGNYTKDGQEKTRWVNIGVIGTSANGKEYCLIDPTVNLAAFHREPGKDMVMCSVFDDQAQQGQQGGYQQPQQQYQQPQQQQAPQNNQQGAAGNYQQGVQVYDQDGNIIPV